MDYEYSTADLSSSWQTAHGFPSVKKRKHSPSPYHSPSKASLSLPPSPEGSPAPKRPTSSNKRTRVSSAHPLSHGTFNHQPRITTSASAFNGQHTAAATAGTSASHLAPAPPLVSPRLHSHGPPRSPLERHTHLWTPHSPPSVQLLPLASRTCKSCKRVAHSTLALSKLKRCYLCDGINCHICARVCHAPSCGKGVCRNCAVESAEGTPTCHGCVSRGEMAVTENEDLATDKEPSEPFDKRFREDHHSDSSISIADYDFS